MAHQLRLQNLLQTVSWSNISVTDTDQASAEEQNYRETMYVVSSYMGWTHVPDIYSAAYSAKDNPLTAIIQQPVGKVSVNLPADNWFCRKMDNLYLTPLV